MAMNGQALVAYPQTAAPSVLTSGNMDSQSVLLQAMLSNMKPDQQATVQAALAQQARIAANKYYLECTDRKLAPSLTNGVASQAYALATPLTFQLTTSLAGFCEGILLKYTVNYTLAAGASAVYGLTPGGVLALISQVEIRYNKSQHIFRPQMLRQLALMGALEDYMIPEGVLAGQSVAWLQNYLNTGMPVTVGANTATIELFVPFNLLGYNDPRGILPIIVGDTGIQAIVTTPQAIFGTHPRDNALYPVSGTGHAVSAVSGTVEVVAVYRDGDVGMSSTKLPFDMSAVQGTFQMQIDTPLQPVIAGNQQRQKLTVMGRHAYILMMVIDGNQSNAYTNNSNITYLESSKDGVGANVLWKYGTQTNLAVQDFFYLKRLDFKQDIDQGIVPFFNGPVIRQGDPHLRGNRVYFDNSNDGWPDWRWSVTLGTTGAVCTPVIEPHVFYINPIGLIPV